MRMPTDLTAPEAPTPTEMTAEGAGDVVLTIPKTDFDTLHTLITQLASMVDGLKSQFDTQQYAAEEEAMGEEMPMSAKDADMADLANFAKELSVQR